MSLQTHPHGNYQFLPGIAPYSGGVVASPGFEIVHVVLAEPVPWRRGFEIVDRFLADQKRPRAALCAMELRSPKPFTFDGFSQFNAGYALVLKSWGLFVDGVNPVARTNVAPLNGLVSEPSLIAFSYTRPAAAPIRSTFIVAGGGELPEGILAAEAIIARGDVSQSGLIAKAEFVFGLMTQRLHGLGGTWTMVTAIDVYTIHDIVAITRQILLPQVGVGGLKGIVWYPTQPPIEEIEFEMDLRGVVTELTIPV